MKLLIFLLSVALFEYLHAYPIEGETSDVVEFQNGTEIDFWMDLHNDTSNITHHSDDMHGIKKKIVDKFKEGLKKVKDKVTGGYDKIKEKLKNFKDKITTGGGGGGGGYNRRDDSDEDTWGDYNNRDNYRPRYKNRYDYDTGSSTGNSAGKWFGLAIGIIIIVGGFIFLIWHKAKS